MPVAAHCTGTVPITCHFDVPPDDKVTVELGGPICALTSVLGRQRRGPVYTAAGHRSRQHITGELARPEGGNQPRRRREQSPGLDTLAFRRHARGAVIAG